MHLSGVALKRETPQIGGSSAAFIAIVICLVLIIIGSSTAIFYLLRQRDSQEASRRQRRYQHPSASSHFDTPVSWFSKLKGPFTSSGRGLNPSATESTRMRSGQGWLQAGSGDEWDTERQIPEMALGSPFFPSDRFGSSASTSSVHFDLHGVGGMTATSVGPSASLPTIYQHSEEGSTATLGPLRTASPEPLNNYSAPTISDQQGHKDSFASARTFSGGTKFIEAL
ncbi:hypothetical protein C8J56DRAFT_1061122 [Mycena floridula]|nr:hypothetical protein C8J56DRAFT_1061122 [Mycena floridula]